jgi:thioredoxin 1
VQELDPQTFDEAIRGEPVLVDFWAPWCRPCRALEPILEQLERRLPVARLNIDEHPDVSARYEILSIPTVMLFAGGEARSTVVGVRPLSYFESWLAEVLPPGELDGLAVQGHVDA